MYNIYKIVLFISAWAWIVFAEDLTNVNYGYSVNNEITGDQKDQQESRSGDSVTGFYRVLDADGYLRTVTYKADKINGFVADVKREPVSNSATISFALKSAFTSSNAGVLPVAQQPIIPFAPRIADAPYSVQAAPVVHLATPFIAKSALDYNV
ncbi:cuticle protein-like [Daktulosphaira vitifoliae]|uniref:cuticle protein-like n=1 Tax=Daktulosphaira vitifoliae TaxID=58002 RepID=UPI0021A9C682|nr:cuticle protein-like [Daktulosphaira vitifoliae]